jgi:hypothetical protein
VEDTLRKELKVLSTMFARRVGSVAVGDSLDIARRDVAHRDLVFCDPPYSEAQYSRFYHVLEGIALGGWGEVSGAGRAPSIDRRAVSQFSKRGGASEKAMTELLGTLRDVEAEVVLTYPEGERSNGLTVDAIRDIASPLFHVVEERVPMKHSTLGGSSSHSTMRRGAKHLHEVLAVLTPR